MQSCLMTGAGSCLVQRQHLNHPKNLGVYCRGADVVEEEEDV